MADTKKVADSDTSNNNPKKKTRKQVEKKLETALSNLKPILGKKKFKRRIKKAGKILTSGIKNISTNGTLKSKTPKRKATPHATTAAPQ
jgi:hypothetical protein